MMPAVEKPSALTTTITSAIYKTTVTMEMMKVAADLSNRLFIVVRTTMPRTIFRMISPKMKNAIQRTIVKARGGREQHRAVLLAALVERFLGILGGGVGALRQYVKEILRPLARNGIDVQARGIVARHARGIQAATPLAPQLILARAAVGGIAVVRGHEDRAVAPVSTAVGIVLNVGFYIYWNKKQKKI